MKKIKRTLALALALVLALSCLSVVAVAADTTGKWDGWTAISNATQLRNIENNLNGKYYLTNDITLPSTWRPIGLDVDAGEIYSFGGQFDGNGYTISTLNYTTDYPYVGLFGYVDADGVVKNATLKVGYVEGYYYVGSVAGYNEGTIQNMSVVNTRTSTAGDVVVTTLDRNNPSRVGGLVGTNATGGKILNCAVAVHVAGYDYVGGLAGQNYGEIRECYSLGNANYSYQAGATARNYVGGLVGGNVGTIEDCFVNVSGRVGGYQRIGGLAGWSGKGSIKRCYTVFTNGGAIATDSNTASYFVGVMSNTTYSQNFFAPTSSTATATGATRVAQSILSNQTSFVNNYATTWDFDNVWCYRNNDGYAYPKLQNAGNPGHIEETTYTVTYTDGVPGVVVFPDQGYEGLKAGDKTPAFVGTPTREGYTFMGWAPAVAEYVTEDVTYVATWKKNPTIYTVTYTDGVEGKIVFPDQAYEVEAGSKTPAFVGTPTREGYTFMGWAPAVAEYVTENVTYVATWQENAKYLHIVDGMTGEEIAVYNDEQVAAMDITTLAYDLKVDAKTEDGTDYLFAGWFTAPQTANDWEHDSWASKSVAGKTLAADDSTIYAWYIKADYTNLTIAYTSNGTKATRTFMLSTVPGDIFNTYAHVMSTAPSADDSTLFKGAVIDGLKANAIEKTTVYTNIAIAPFSAQSPKTANDFNGGLGGIYQNGTNGYISYTLINNIPVGKTVFVRPYYVTMEGTTIYGSTTQATIAAYANVTGLEG